MNELIKIDLHCHSNLSDGILSPEILAEVLTASNVRYASLTDHDCIKGINRFKKAVVSRGIGFISGVEISVGYPKSDFHLLAYGFEPENHDFKHTLLAISHNRMFDPHYILAKVSRTIKSIGSKLFYQNIKNTKVKKNEEHNLNNLHCVNRENIKTFNHFWDDNHSDYITPDEIKIHQVIDLIHHAGGLAILPHPFTLEKNPEKLEKALIKLKADGLDGIEVFYKPYSAELINLLLDLALKYDFLICAGSDFHGDTFPGFSKPGVDIPLMYWEKFKKQIELCSINK